jgi:DNA polymerase alpha subunit B
LVLRDVAGYSIEGLSPLLNATMPETKEDLNGYFSPSSDNGLPPEILGELESMLRLHSISPQELFYKWESYSLKMGSEDTKLDLNTVRMFKKDVQDGLEREHRGKHTARNDRRNGAAATPRGAITGDVFGM